MMSLYKDFRPGVSSIFSGFIAFLYGLKNRNLGLNLTQTLLPIYINNRHWLNEVTTNNWAKHKQDVFTSWDVDEDVRENIADQFGVIESSVFKSRLGQRLGIIEDFEKSRDEFGTRVAAGNSNAEDRLKTWQNLILRDFVWRTEKKTIN